MKRLAVFMLAIVMTLSLAACGGSKTPDKPDDASAGDAPETIVIKMGHTGNETCMMQKGYEAFKEYVEKASNGVFQVDIFANGQLGNDIDHVTACQNGDLQVIGINNGYMTSFQPANSVFAMPFAFKSQDVAYAVLEGEWGQMMLDNMETGCGLKGLSYIDSFAYRELTANKEIRTPADMQGLKIRVMSNPVHIAIWESLGANPSAIAFSELYTALQQRTVDAQENPFENIVTARLYEVQDHIMLTNHVYTTGMLLANPDWFNGLAPELQQIVLDGAKAAYEYEKAAGAEELDGYMKTCTDAGVKIVDLTNEELAAFEQQCTPAIDLIREQVGDELVESLYAAIAEAENGLK